MAYAVDTLLRRQGKAQLGARYGQHLFAQLIGSVSQADDIILGNRAPSRELQVSPLQVRDIRRSTGLSQQNFARIIHVDVGTLRNWEQGRRYPTGPARALLHVIMSNPKETLRVLSEAE